MRAAFITGLGLHPIRQCLLENKTLDLQTAYTRASSLDLVEQDNDLYTTLEAHMSAIVDLEPTKRPPVEPNEPAVAATCGFPYHLLERCPALVTTRKKISKQIDYACACPSKPLSNSLATVAGLHILTTLTNVPRELYLASIVNGGELGSLFGSCSTDSFLGEGVVWELNFKVHPVSPWPIKH